MLHRIFLVEDHAVMRAALTTLIGCEADLDVCGVAASAEEALAVRPWAACDLLLTDVSLPGMDGIALAEHARAERPDLPVVVVSADAGPDAVGRARGAGVRAFLSKARLGDTLAPTLRDVMRGGAPPGER